MSIRNLNAPFTPTTIALIGASNRPGSILARNLLEGDLLAILTKGVVAC
ncbi:hypothetical protein [Halomonas sp. QHL1]|nr:hypothetical protein [Halomonas sp. QHL1]